MKKLVFFLFSLLIGIYTFASVVTVTVNGNKNYQVIIDGKVYTAANTTSSASKKTFTITDLSVGQHTLQVYRMNNNNRRGGELYSSSFNLRANYDIKITINGNNGKVRIVETDNNEAYSNGNANNNSYRTAMSSSEYTTLYNSIRNNWGLGAKMNAAVNAFNTESYYFTVAQSKQIIQLLSSEANRLELAKLAIDNLVDVSNYQSLYDLFRNQASINELNSYVQNYGYNNSNSGNSTTYRSAMTDAEFNNVYQTIRSKWLPGGKMSAAAQAFNTSSYYFSTAQIKQIIQLLSSETNRLELAKLALDNAVDPQNYRNLYDLFSSQSSRDELDNYIRTYGN